MKQPAPVEQLSTSALTLPSWSFRALTYQAVFLGLASFVLPALAHASGISVRLLLPMHWPVLLVGLCYGWRGGLAVGLAAPGLSYLLSGMPYPIMIPPMMVELAASGFVAGFVREHLRGNPFLAVLVAVVVGRIVFIATVAATGAAGGALLPYLQVAVLPGMGASIAQIAILPFAARWWVSRRSGAE